MHGAFSFSEQCLVLADGTESRYLAYTKQEAVRVGLEEFSLSYSNRLSFHEVALLITRTSGQALVCEQTLWNWVHNQATQLAAHLAKEGAASWELPFPTLAQTLDIYAAEAEEVLVWTDGIGVKAQKPYRDKPGATPTGKQAKRHDTDVMLLQKPDGGFTYVSGSSDGRVSLGQVAEARLRRLWDGRDTPVPVVTLTHGARTMRPDLAQLFGSCVRVILDWYQLAKRVYAHLWMCAHSRAEREEWERAVLGFLWQGQVPTALAFLAGVPARNAKALAELVGYLEKHASEIIDYARRQAVGKPIGSGRDGKRRGSSHWPTPEKEGHELEQAR